MPIPCSPEPWCRPSARCCPRRTSASRPGGRRPPPTSRPGRRTERSSSCLGSTTTRRPTTWGYYGASFLHSLIDRPVIEPVPEAYYRDPEVDALVGRLQAEILRGKGDVKGLLQALGARYIVLRRDLDTTFPGRSLASPDLLARSVGRRAGIRHLRGFGEADVYEAPGVRMPEVYPALPVIEDEGSLSAVRRAVAVPRRAAVVRPEAGDALVGIPKGQARVVTPKRRLAVNLEYGAVVVRPPRRTAGAAPPLVLLPAPDPPFDVLVGRRRLEVSDSPDASRRLAVVRPPELAEGRGYFPPERVELGVALANRVGDCHRYDDRSRRRGRHRRGRHRR